MYDFLRLQLKYINFLTAYEDICSFNVHLNAVYLYFDAKYVTRTLGTLIQITSHKTVYLFIVQPS